MHIADAITHMLLKQTLAIPSTYFSHQDATHKRSRLSHKLSVSQTGHEMRHELFELQYFLQASYEPFGESGISHTFAT
jgi:hypothetical protein